MPNKIKSHKKSKMFFCCFLGLMLVIMMTGCNKSNLSRDGEPDTSSPYITKSSFLLNTVISITIYDKKEEEILDGCFDLIADYESIYSRTDEESELYAINHGTAPHNGLTYRISDNMSNLLKYGLYYSALSMGAFDISIAPVSSLWDFTAPNPVLPDPEDITGALPLIGYENISLDGNELTFTKDGMAMDLGAIAKGYIADRVKEYLVNNGVNSAIINLGGNILCVGNKPDGTPFKVGIQKPYADRNETVAVMEISDLSVVSSGVYERFFTIDGVSYHHILNPKTGYPYDSDLISVTIVSEKSVDGDGLSTTCFALDLEEGLKLIESLPGTYAAFITSDYEIHYSKGFQDAIKIIDQQ